MNTALIIGGVTIVACVMIWALIKISEATGEARALREQADRNAANANKAGTVIAENRTTGDAVGRLHRGDF